MNLWSAILMGFKEIQAHKFRSLLSMLGIILGVASLVGMSALVKGMEVGMRQALIAAGGIEKVRVEPQDVPIEQRHLMDQAVGVTINDVFALKNSAPLVTKISPEMHAYGATVTLGSKRTRPFICAGVWPVALEMTEHVVEHGRMFNEIDDELARNVCVIGTGVRDELFGAPEKTGEEIIPIGETLMINRQPFVIIGMFQHYESDQDRVKRELAKLEAQMGVVQTGPARKKGWGGSDNFIYRMKNNTLFMPLNTMWIKIRSGGGATRPTWGSRGMNTDSSNPPDPRLSSLELKVQSVDVLLPAIQQIHNVLMSTHKGIEDFTFRTQEDRAESITAFIDNARMSRGLISAISLLVGGIGIMNIMLASISERVREIGIRKSVGANTQDIFVQIMVESVVIAVLGGLAGLACSFALVNFLGQLSPTDNRPIITVVSMLVAFSYSVLVGLAAGLIPAIRASRLHPIQALRYD